MHDSLGQQKASPPCQYPSMHAGAAIQGTTGLLGNVFNAVSNVAIRVGGGAAEVGNAVQGRRLLSRRLAVDGS